MTVEVNIIYEMNNVTVVHKIRNYQISNSAPKILIRTESIK